MWVKTQLGDWVNMVVQKGLFVEENDFRNSLDKYWVDVYAGGENGITIKQFDTMEEAHALKDKIIGHMKDGVRFYDVTTDEVTK